jgi:hypothetical protein
LLSDAHKANFETLKRAAADGNLALMHCTNIKTGLPLAVVCAVEVPAEEGGDYNFVPLAKLFCGNPYHEVMPPGDEDDTPAPSEPHRVSAPCSEEDWPKNPDGSPMEYREVQARGIEVIKGRGKVLSNGRTLDFDDAAAIQRSLNFSKEFMDQDDLALRVIKQPARPSPFTLATDIKNARKKEE